MALFLPTPRVLARSFVAIPRNSVNDATDANETQLVAVTIPANTLGANGFIRVTGMWSYTNSATTKTMRVRFGASGAGTGGTGYHSQSATTTASQMQQTIIGNRNATNSQVGPTSAGTGGWSTSATAFVTSAVDTTAAAEVHFGCLFGGAASAQTITLEGYVVEVFPA